MTQGRLRKSWFLTCTAPSRSERVLASRSTGTLGSPRSLPQETLHHARKPLIFTLDTATWRTPDWTPILRLAWWNKCGDGRDNAATIGLR